MLCNKSISPQKKFTPNSLSVFRFSRDGAKRDTEADKRIDCLGIYSCNTLSERGTGCCMHRWCSVEQMGESFLSLSEMAFLWALLIIWCQIRMSFYVKARPFYLWWRRMIWLLHSCHPSALLNAHNPWAMDWSLLYHFSSKEMLILDQGTHGFCQFKNQIITSTVL